MLVSHTLCKKSQEQFAPEASILETKWGGVSESPYKKGGPVSVLGRAR